MIHPTAIVSSQVKLASTVEVGPYSIVEDDVEVDSGTMIAAHAILRSGTRIGKNCLVDSNSVIGGLPQDLSFDSSTVTYVRIGNNVTIREGSTINRSTEPGGATLIGDDCLLMALSHVAHDCVLGLGVIMANNCMLAGHVSVGDNTFLGGGAGVHQFCRIGGGCMVGGNASISKDVPPYVMVAERNRLVGLNLIGLRRRGVTRESIQFLKHCFQEMHNRAGKPSLIAEALMEGEDIQSEEAQAFLGFYLTGKRGFVSPQSD